MNIEIDYIDRENVKNFQSFKRYNKSHGHWLSIEDKKTRATWAKTQDSGLR